MNRIARLILPIAAFAGLGAVGLLAARAVGGADDPAVSARTSQPSAVQLGPGSDAAATPATGALSAADLSPVPDRLVPVLAPVAVAVAPDDTAPGVDLERRGVPAADVLAVPAAPSGEAPDVVGAAAAYVPVSDAPLLTDPPVGASGDGGPAAFDGSPWFALHPDVDRLELLGPIAFDPCAGVSPGGTPADDCGPGYAATFGGTLGPTPPRPFMYVNPGHWPAGSTPEIRGCPSAPAPSDTMAEMMLTTHTPLAQARMRYRPYGSSDPWVEFDIGPTIDSEAAWWDEQLRGGDFDPIESMLSTCFSVPHDPTIPYEYEASATDVFGRLVVQQGQPRLLPGLNPTLRPVATAEIDGLTPVANVKAWSTSAGFVSFTHREVAAGDDLSCAGATSVAESQLVRGVGPPEPPGLYDPQYSRGWGAAIPLLPGRSMLVCANVHPTDNRFQVSFTDRLLINAPSQEQPRIVLQAVRRGGDATIPARSLRVAAGRHISTGERSSCDGGAVLDELAPGRTQRVEQVIWECTSVPIPVDRTGNLVVPVRVQRDFTPGAAGGEQTIDIAIPIRLTDCRDASGCRGREWFELPIPVERGGLCGSSFGLGCDAPYDGTLVLRVDYPVVPGAAGGDGAVSSLDSIVVVPSEQPVSDITRVATYPGTDPFHADVEVLIPLVDRPVQMTVFAEEYGPDGPVTDTCATLAPQTTTGFSERPTVAFADLCRGLFYRFTVQLVDESGARFDGDPAGIRLSHVTAPTTVALQLFGGDGLPALGDFDGIKVLLNGAQQTAYWWESDAIRTGAARSCLGLDGTTFTPNGTPQAPYWSQDMTVEVEVTISTSGTTDCDGGRRSGLGRIGFTTTLTAEQLLSREVIVINSPADSPLRMQLRLSFGVWSPWGPNLAS